MKKVSVLGPRSAVLVLTLLAAACAVSGCDSGATQSRPPAGLCAGLCARVRPGLPARLRTAARIRASPVPAARRPATARSLRPVASAASPDYGPQPGYGRSPAGLSPASPHARRAERRLVPRADQHREHPGDLAAATRRRAASSRSRPACGRASTATRTRPRRRPSCTSRRARRWRSRTTRRSGSRSASSAARSSRPWRRASARASSRGPPAATQSGVTGASGPPVIVADALPATVDHRQQNLEGPIKDQGPVGACTAFSLSTTIDNAAIRAGKMQAGVAGPGLVGEPRLGRIRLPADGHRRRRDARSRDRADVALGTEPLRVVRDREPDHRRLRHRREPARRRRNVPPGSRARREVRSRRRRRPLQGGRLRQARRRSHPGEHRADHADARDRRRPLGRVPDRRLRVVERRR